MKFFSFLASVLLLFCFSEGIFAQTTSNKFIVVLDAGHGGKDPGNLGNGYKEKDIALKIVLKLGAILEADSSFKVIYTRKTDVFVQLWERGEIANDADADLFISIHCDSFDKPNVFGAGTWVLTTDVNAENLRFARKENAAIYYEDNYESKYDNFSSTDLINNTIMQGEYLDQSIDLSKRIQDNFVNIYNRKDRKAKQDDFQVLRETFMPSVMVEAGFLTNKEEGEYLNSSKGQQEVAQAIALAVKDYRSVYGDLYDTSTPNVLAGDPGNEGNENTSSGPTSDNSVAMSTDEIMNEAVYDAPKEEKQVPKTTQKEATGIIFKVQIAASSQDLSLTGNNFKGLANLSKEPHKDFYRYFYGKTPSYEKAQFYQQLAKDKGYSDCFIVAYKNNKRISLDEAIKSSQ